MNGQKILGRPMAVDWSLPKNVYEKMHKQESSASVQSDSYGIQSNPNPPEIKEEQVEMEQDEEEEVEVEEEIPKIRTDESSRDVREHRTLFIRNIPFDVTEDDLSNILSSNGKRRILSCRLVVDPISKHPRGSAFVQFVSTNDAEECLNLSFTCHGQELQIDMALGRNELVKAKELRDKKKENNKKSDQRNLSLANYGVILNLSELDGNENDLRKRQKLEDVKKQKLKDPSFFISPTRLTIHNLPVNIDDTKLRNIIIQTLKDNHIPMKDIVLNECRVMRKNKEAKKSLGYGFINLSRHEIALRVIELLNNNKHVFGPNRRPIVQFSIENHRALQLKDQRLERIRAKQELLKNPTNKILAFESNKKKKRASNLLEQTKNKIRLSEIIKQEEEEEESNDNKDFKHDEVNNSNIEKSKKEKNDQKQNLKVKFVINLIE